MKELTLREYVDQYCLEHDLATRTIEHYRASVVSFDKWRGQPVFLAELADDLVNRFLADQKADAFAAATIRSKRTDILCLWRAAVEVNLVEHLPARVRRIKLPSQIPCAWSIEEIKRLITSAESINTWTADGLHRGRLLTAFVRVAYDTALRRGDLLALGTSQIDDEGFVDLTQNKTATGHIVKLSAVTLVAVLATLADRKRQLIFDQKPAWFNDWWGKLLVKAQLRKGPREMQQKMRRSAASHAERERTGSGRHLLGHKSHGLAEKHYLDPRICREVISPPEID